MKITTMGRRCLIASLGVLLVAGLAAATEAAAQEPPPAVTGVPHTPPRERSVKGKPLAVPPVKPDPTTRRALRGTPKAASPRPAVAEITPVEPGPDHLGAAAAPVEVGGLPVRVGASPAEAGRTAVAGRPAKVRVEVLGGEAATAAGVPGVLLKLRRADGGTGEGTVTLDLDYSGFRHAYGGDWASRLRVVRLPACAVTTPDRADCRRAAALRGRNDVRNGRASAQVLVAAEDGVYALAAAPSGGAGDYTATSLSPSGSWQVSTQTGDFAWSHPLRTPPVPGGLTPDPVLRYASSGVDGRTASTNNQPSWAGEGWNLWSGFIERRYKSCAQDTAGGSPETGDLCWGGENATLSFEGGSGELVFDAAENIWRPKQDDGSRVEHLFDTVNGDDNGEYWRVTTIDGTQYHFGLNRLPNWSDGRPETRSAWSVPVFGNDDGEPCHGAAFAASSCPQAYRWNLDYVVDTHGNTISYYYEPEINAYGVNMATAKATYTRGGTLRRVEYGTRRGSEYTDPAPARVLFDTADRCVPGADCSARTPASWPDVPWDQHCETATCPERYSPTFWSTKRLERVTTQVRDGDGYRDVDVWRLDHEFPAPGDGTGAALWLKGITHSGRVGGEKTLPAVTFGGIPLENRVNSGTDGLPPMDKYRLYEVHTESGGVISVNYAPANCAPGSLPVPHASPLRCMPVRWTPEGGQVFDDWFHKYVVAEVVRTDRVGGNPVEVTGYDYEGDAAWAYNDDPLVAPEFRSWTGWRGYERVLVRHGDPGDSSRPQSATRYQYFRGMDGDHQPGGGTRTAWITDSQGARLADAAPLAGFLREEITYNGVEGAVVSGTINDAWQRGPTAVRGPLKAYMVRAGRSVTRTALDSGWRIAEVRTSHDDHGLPVKVDDLGDAATADDDRCTTTAYARTGGDRLPALPSRVTTIGVACDGSPSFPRDAISDVRTYYDGKDLGAAPEKGDVTRIEEVSGYSGGTPEYVTVMRAGHDDYGRVTESYDALGNKTTTSYTPAAGLPTSSTVTNALGHRVTTTFEPAWNLAVATVDTDDRRSDLDYDPLGRLTRVWLPGRSKEAGWGPNLRFGYGVRSDGASWVSTERLTASGDYITGYELYDGFLRLRQTQTPAWGGGRVLTDTFHDSRGLVAKRNAAYYEKEAPGTDLLLVGDNQIPAQTVTVYDGAERPTAVIHAKLAEERWRTGMAYGGDAKGDYTKVTPPAGGTPTLTYTDARGRRTELRQYDAATPAGAHQATRYSYTRAGDLASLTDAAGNVWRYGYDVRRRRVRIDDPDKGVTTMTYDDAGRRVTATDARGSTVAYVYDELGRKTALHRDSPAGPKLAAWTYDTLVKGRLGSATRFVDGHAYTTAVTAYDEAGRPLEQTVTIPAAEGELAGTYTSTVTYLADGSVDTVALPALGDLPAETITYGYDSLGKLSTTRGAADYVTDTDYTRLSELSQLQLGPAGKRVWQSLYYEEGTRRLARSWIEQEQQGKAQVDKIDYAYDPAGNVKRISTLTGGGGPDVQCFAYDGLRRLTEAWAATDECAGRPDDAIGGVAPYWSSYRYDAAGNRTSETRHGLAGAADTVSTSTYPAAGESRPHAPATITVTGPTGTKALSYAYDASGNTTSRPAEAGAQTLDWDAEGRLISATAGGKSTGRVYDADGKLLITRDAAGATLHLAGGNIRREGGKLTGTRYYLHGDTAVAARTASGVSYLFGDHHGTSDLAVNAGTLAVAKRRFDPYGAPRGPQPASWPDDRGFVGGIQDASTGLTRLGARDYDPATGLFLSVDPVLDGDSPQQLNAYAYASHNPATLSDPTGLRPEDNPGYCEVWRGDCGFAPSDARAVPSGRYTPGQVSRLRTRMRGTTRNSPDGECWRGCAHKPWRGPASRVAARTITREQAERLRRNALVAEQFEKMRQLVEDVPILQGALPQLMAGIEFISDGHVKSGSICMEGGVSVVISMAGEVCMDFDSKGFAIHWALKTGVTLGMEAYAGLTVKLNSQTAEQVGRSPDWSPGTQHGTTSARAALEKIAKDWNSPKFGWQPDVEFSMENQGTPDASASIAFRLFYGYSATGGGHYGTVGGNSGYVPW